MKIEHMGSDFDDFLRVEGLLEETEAVAVKRVLAHQIAQAMERQDLTKAAMARRMGTSRSSLDRLLDPRVPSVTLLTIEKAARVLGKQVRIEMVDATEESQPSLHQLEDHLQQARTTARRAGVQPADVQRAIKRARTGR